MSNAPHRYASVVLGFADPPSTSFHPYSFPSKAGGRPVWLHLPPTAAPPPPRCKICSRPQQFLLQIYAPVEPQLVAHDEAFHRTLYVAICPSASCQRRSDCVTVLRAQLPQRNQCYPYEAVEEPELIKEPDVCVLCGFAAAKRCAQCHRVSYCARACQLQDWKLGHKDECAGGVTKDDMDARRVKCRLREMEIVTEQHPTPDTSDDEDDSEGEDAHVETLSPNGDASEGGVEQEDAKAETLPPSGDAHPSGTVTRVSTAVNVDEMPVRGTFQDADGDELPEEIFRGRGRGLGANDASTSHFQRVVGYASSQVVRYEWDGLALWAARGGRCGEAGACQRCGAPRVFEMQVMPQLAWYVRHDDARATIEAVAERLRDGMEWATIAVYSCSRSCPLGDVYAREMAWAQAFDAPCGPPARRS